MPQPTNEPNHSHDPATPKLRARVNRQPKARNRCRHVLVVGQPAAMAPAVEACGTTRRPYVVLSADTLADARKLLRKQPVELALIAPQLPDGPGTELTQTLQQAKEPAAVIVVSQTPDLDAATAAMQHGACDFLVAPQPPAPGELAVRLERAMTKRDRQAANARRVRRLKRLCKKLNDARIDISKQVDVLCADLVTAYQELAQQFNHAMQSNAYKTVIDHELDLENVLRRTLEHLVQKTGPANAAIFLPANMDEYSLGGYVNYDCPAGSLDMLLDHLADVAAPKLATLGDFAHLRSNAELEKMFGDDAAYLADCEVIGVPCCSGKGDDAECLAVVVVFRDADQPFSDEALELCSTMGPLLGQTLEKIIRVHHRASMHDEGPYDTTPDVDDHYDNTGDAHDDGEELPF